MTYVPDRSYPVIVQIRDVLEAMSGLLAATGTITFSSTPAEVPTANDTLIISDGVTAITYTWKAEPAAANDVEIGATATISAANLLAAINANAPDLTDNLGRAIADPARGIVAVATTALVITLTNTIMGALGNVAITDGTDNVEVTGMANGADGGAI